MRAIGPVVLVHRQTDYGPRTRACAPAHDEQLVTINLNATLCYAWARDQLLGRDAEAG
jgi:hypothetical protein